MHRMLTMGARPRQTDGHTDIMTVVRLFILTNTSRAKNKRNEKKTIACWRIHACLTRVLVYTPLYTEERVAAVHCSKWALATTVQWCCGFITRRIFTQRIAS